MRSAVFVVALDSLLFVKFKFMKSSSIRALDSCTPNMLQWHAEKPDEFCFIPSFEVLDREDLVLDFF